MSVKRMLRPVGCGKSGVNHGARRVTCVDVRECWTSAQVYVPVRRVLELDSAFVGLDDPEAVRRRRACAVRERQAEGKDDESKTKTVLHCAGPRTCGRARRQTRFRPGVFQKQVEEKKLLEKGQMM